MTAKTPGLVPGATVADWLFRSPPTVPEPPIRPERPMIVPPGFGKRIVAQTQTVIKLERGPNRDVNRRIVH